MIPCPDEALRKWMKKRNKKENIKTRKEGRRRREEGRGTGRCALIR